MKTENIIWLQEWFVNQSNADWEHSFGICIETLDNPGWHVSISLERTPLATKLFTQVKEERNDEDWMMCCVQNGKFEGFCGPRNLLKIIEVFRRWSEV